MLMADHEGGHAVGADSLTLLADGEVAFAGPGDRLLSDPKRSRELGMRPLEMPLLLAALGREERPLTPEAAAETLKAEGWRIDEDAYAALPNGEAVRDQRAHTLIELQDVSFTYREGAVEALKEVSLRIREGEFVAILGENGSGKTTLAKHLNGLLWPEEGRVTVCGMETRGARPRQLAREVGYLFQNPDHQIFAGRVDEEIAFGPRNLEVSEAEVRSRVRQVLELVSLEGYEERDPFVLTKGERQRVALASVLAARPRIIVFDEPTTGLDGPQQEQMMHLLARLNGAGQTIVVITHCTWAAAEYARRVVLMDQGSIVADVTPRQLFGDPELLSETGQVVPAVARFSQALGGKTLLSVKEALDCLRPPEPEVEA
jgi:energy-coupling factor transporter ATP-binding protein EcfA2